MLRAVFLTLLLALAPVVPAGFGDDCVLPAAADRAEPEATGGCGHAVCRHHRPPAPPTPAGIGCTAEDVHAPHHDPHDVGCTGCDDCPSRLLAVAPTADRDDRADTGPPVAPAPPLPSVIGAAAPAATSARGPPDRGDPATRSRLRTVRSVRFDH